VFEKELKDKFKSIFAVNKVTYDTPGESEEKGTLFVQVENPKFSFKDGRVTAMVTGNAVIFGRGNELTFGFLSKAISTAHAELTKDLFFSDFESNTQRLRDIVQRGFSFTYIFKSQFDPAIGTMESVTTTVEES
jgi:hypothetical protein